MQAGFIGVGAATETVQQPATAVLPAVGDNVTRVAGIIVNAAAAHHRRRQRGLRAGRARPERADLASSASGRVAGEIASLDEIAGRRSKAAELIGLLASLNIALFVFNMIPLLPLDGGHIAGALWEAIRRGFAKLFKRPDPGPVDLAKLMPLTLAVVVVFGAMSALLIYADIVKPVSLF